MSKGRDFSTTEGIGPIPKEGLPTHELQPEIKSKEATKPSDQETKDSKIEERYAQDFLLKTIRAEEFGNALNSYNFNTKSWRYAVYSLTNPTDLKDAKNEYYKFRRPLRAKQSKKKYGYKTTTKGILKKGDSLWLPSEKSGYSKQTSMTFVSPKQNYFPAPADFDGNGVRVGIAIHPDLVKLQRIALDDINSYYYNYMYYSKDDAEAAATKFVTKLSEIATHKAFNKSFNEVMVRARFDPQPQYHCQILVELNNLESRLVAQIRAKDLQLRLKEMQHPNYQETQAVPIGFYLIEANPPYQPYSEDDQKKDLVTAITWDKDNRISGLACFLQLQENDFKFKMEKDSFTKKQFKFIVKVATSLTWESGSLFYNNFVLPNLEKILEQIEADANLDLMLDIFNCVPLEERPHLWSHVCTTPNLKSIYLFSLMNLDCLEHDEEELNKLLDSEDIIFNFNLKLPNGDSLYDYAVKHFLFEIANKIGQKHKELINPSVYLWGEVLIVAVKQGNFEATKFIIERHPEVINFSSPPTKTALHWAIFLGNYDLTVLILSTPEGKKFKDAKVSDDHDFYYELAHIVERAHKNNREKDVEEWLKLLSIDELRKLPKNNAGLLCGELFRKNYEKLTKPAVKIRDEKKPENYEQSNREKAYDKAHMQYVKVHMQDMESLIQLEDYSAMLDDYNATKKSKIDYQQLHKALGLNFLNHIEENEEKKIESLLQLPFLPKDFIDKTLQIIMEFNQPRFFIKQTMLRNYLNSEQKERIDKYVKDKIKPDELVEEVIKAFKAGDLVLMKKFLEFLDEKTFERISKIKTKSLGELLFEINKGDHTCTESEYYQLILTIKPELFINDKDLRDKALSLRIIDANWIDLNENLITKEEQEAKIIYTLRPLMNSTHYLSAIKNIQTLISDGRMTPGLSQKIIEMIHEDKLYHFGKGQTDRLDLNTYLELIDFFPKDDYLKFKILHALHNSTDYITNFGLYNEGIINKMAALSEEFKEDYTIFYKFIEKVNLMADFAYPDSIEFILEILKKIKVPKVFYEVEKNAEILRLKLEGFIKMGKIYQYIQSHAEPSEPLKPHESISAYTSEELQQSLLCRLTVLFHQIHLFPTQFDERFSEVIQQMHYYHLLLEPQNVAHIMRCIHKTCPPDRRKEFEGKLAELLKYYGIAVAVKEEEKISDFPAHFSVLRSIENGWLSDLKSIPDVLSALQTREPTSLTPSQILQEIKTNETADAHQFISLKLNDDITRLKFETHDAAIAFEKICKSSKADSQLRGGTLISSHPEDKEGQKRYIINLSQGDIAALQKKTKMDLRTHLEKRGKIQPFISYLLVMDSLETAKKFMEKYDVRLSKNVENEPGAPILKSIIKIPGRYLDKPKYGIYLSSEDLNKIQQKLMDRKKVAYKVSEFKKFKKE